MAKRISSPKKFQLQNTNNTVDLGLTNIPGVIQNIGPIMYEPKRKNRFILRFPTVLNIPSWFVMAVTRPSVNIVIGSDDVLIDWDDVEIILRDPIGPNASQRLYEALMDGTFNREHIFTLDILGPDNDNIETWTIIGKITNIDFGELSYTANNEITTINLTIQTSSCSLTQR